jgi:two-component system response regulator MprA
MTLRCQDAVQVRSEAPLLPNAGAVNAADRTIFVVDDDPSLVDSLVDLLLDEGYMALGFTRPLEALERLRAGARPRVLLLDYLMPEMNGEEFLAALAAERVELPVLLLSGMNDPGIEGAVAGVILKPFDLDRLLAEMTRLTGRAHS